MGRGPKLKGAKARKPKDFKASLIKLMTFLKPYYFKLIIVLIFSIGSTVFFIAGPKVLADVTTLIFEGLVGKITGTSAGIDFTRISRILLILLSLYLVSAVFSFIQSFIVANVAQDVSYNLRKDISQKINRLPLKYFDTHSHGDVLSRMTNDVDTVSQTLNQSLSQIVRAITTLIGIIIIMLTINLTMTLVSILIIPISATLILSLVKVSQKFFRNQQIYLGEANGYVEETFSGHIVMKAFSAEDAANKNFQYINEDLYESAWKSQFFAGLSQPIMMFIGNLGYVVASILGVYLTIIGSIRVGDILAFIQYIRRFNQPIGEIAEISNVLQTSVAASERIFEFLEEDEIPVESTEKSLSDAKGQVEFKNVSFGYNDDEMVINNFSLKVNPGQNVAIVGPTGAGKTTIVKLLMRFYEVNEGSILIDGTDITDIPRSDLRSTLGMVLQDTWLFNGTIMENIRYGKLSATDEEVVNASKASYVDHFVRTLPEDYNLIIDEEGSNISQGQKQLLTIARVFLNDPNILILDEATSSVDTRTEVLIQNGMEELMEGRTSFVIAHRLSTIRNADLILVLDDGDIVETGNHDELIDRKGFYYNLYQSQFEE
ncbi:MAG: ABC transporter ATP-binding protein [Clostridium sp.]|nr:ABC transporter ATP-binding protein [Clostridium sp.]